MGQMHVLKALGDQAGPTGMLITDLSQPRLDALGERIQRVETAATPEVTLRHGSQPLAPVVSGGFDDVVVMVPSAAVIAEAAQHLRRGGYLNIFAGVKVGTYADLPLRLFTSDAVRVAGSSGSPLSAMVHTLKLVTEGRLVTELSLAAVSDMQSVSAGLRAAQQGTFTGKVVVFPFASGIGLASLDQLGKQEPDLGEEMDAGRYWNGVVEARFLKSRYFASAPGC